MAIIISTDEADYQVLSKFDNGDVLSMPIGIVTPGYIQAAVDRMIDSEFFSLMDIRPRPGVEPDGALWRVFRLTSAGKRRRGELKIQFAVKEAANVNIITN